MTDWINTTQSNTTARNVSRFLSYHPIDSSLASGGIDFLHTFNSQAPFYFDSTTPIAFSTDTRF